MVCGQVPRLLIPAVLILVMLFALAPGVLAQPAHPVPIDQGQEYWLTIDRNGHVDPSSDPGVAIIGAEGTTGTVSVPGQGFSQDYMIPASGVVHVALATSLVHGSPFIKIEPRGIRVTASADVRVTGYDPNSYSPGAYLGLPVSALGTDYLVLDYWKTPPASCEDGFCGNNAHLGQFSVVATADDTTVRIALSIAWDGYVPGESYEIELDAGDIYTLVGPSYVTEPLDFTGSTVSADKPVAVFAGHELAFIPDQNTYAADFITEQLPPVDAWGQTFLTMPLPRTPEWDIVRILAASDDTVVSLDGVALATLDRGEFHELGLSAPAEITASSPVLVAQYARGAYSDDQNIGDPLMMLIPPVEGFLAEYKIASLADRPPLAASLNVVEYAHIVVPADAVGSVTLNDAVIAPALFAPIGTSGYVGARVMLPEIPDGVHAIESSVPAGVVVYGLGETMGYGYPAGWGVSESTPSQPEIASVTLTPEDASPTVGEEHCVVATVLDANSQPLADISVGFAVSGTHAETGSGVSNASGEASFCYTGTSYGEDMIEVTRAGLSDTASATWRTVNVAPAVEIEEPAAGTILAAGNVILSASFSDANPDDTHTCTIDWGEGPVAGDTSVAGTCSGSTTLGAGTYDIAVTVTDDRGLSATDSVSITVFDPTLIAAGSGAIMSPRGAVANNPTAVNRAVFSFAVSYAEGASTPGGPVTFTYSGGTFQATSLDLLLIDGSDIRIEGSGTINGRGDYTFMLTATDGNPDAFRIQIWNGSSVVYDNGTLQRLLAGIITIR